MGHPGIWAGAWQDAEVKRGGRPDDVHDGHPLGAAQLVDGDDDRAGERNGEGGPGESGHGDFSLGLDAFRLLWPERAVTKLPLDCPLMLEHPDDFIGAFADAGADMISVQQEVCRHLHRTLQNIADHGMYPAVVINPATPVETLVEVLPMVHHVLVMSVNPGFGGQKFLPLALGKIAHLAHMREAMGLNFRIEVDGGVAPETVER